MSAFNKPMAVGLPALAGAALGIFGFAGLFSEPQLDYFGVKLEIDGNRLVVDKSNKCNNGPHNGCLLFEETKIGVIKFYLTGSKNKVRTCDDNNVDAVITSIHLTTKGVNDSPDDEKGDYNATLDPWLEEFAFPGVKPDGEVYLADVEDARTQAWIVNMNSHLSEDGLKRFWYKVTATDCGDKKITYVTDPRADNEGRS